MKLKSLSLIVSLFALPIAGFAQFTAKIDSRASVIFPSKPKEMQQQGYPILYSLLDVENKVTGMATSIDASQYGIDSNTMVANYNNVLFVDLILQNIIGQYSGMQVVSKKKIAVGKLMGYEVVLNNDMPTEEVPYKSIYAQVFFTGTQIYALTVLAEDKVDATKERNKFFTSLKVD